MSRQQQIAIEDKTFLAVPYDERHDAMLAGGRIDSRTRGIEFDRQYHLWYAKKGADLTKLKKWLPDPQRFNQPTDSDPQVEFYNVLETAGFVLKTPPIMDGRIHRVATQEDKAGKTSGVYAAFNDGRPAGWYQDHRRHSEPQKWHASGKPADVLTQLHLKAYMAQQQYTREKQIKSRHQHHANRVQQAYQLMPNAMPEQGYLSKKGIVAYADVKQDKRGRLVIPLYDTNHQVKSLQRISPNGFKTLKKHAQKSGHFFVVGDHALEDGKPVLYAEGYSTAASIAQATGRSVVMTIDAGNMPKVAEKLAGIYPESLHIFLADNDIANSTNKGLEKAREAAEKTRGCWLTPDFTYEETQGGLTDFNDLQQSRGINEVTEQIEGWIHKLRLDPANTNDLNTLNTIEKLEPENKEIASSNGDKKHHAKPASSHAARWLADSFAKMAALKQEQLPINEQTGHHAEQRSQSESAETLKGYIGVKGKYYFANRPNILAFVDKGSKLKTRLTQATVIGSMLTIAKQRDWQQISLSGSKAFKQEAWLRATQQGMQVKGYRPNQADLLRLKQIQQPHSQHPQIQKPQLAQHAPTHSQSNKPATSSEIDTQVKLQTSNEEPSKMSVTVMKPSVYQTNTHINLKANFKKERESNHELEL